MFAWLYENIETIIICAILLAAVIAVIVSMVRKKKQGKSTCGCGCADCPMGDFCGNRK